MGADFYLYQAVDYGKDTIRSETNIFPNDYKPYITTIRMTDMASLWERIGEGDRWFPNVIDSEECDRCDEINPDFKHRGWFSCDECSAGIKLDYFMFADRGDEKVKVFISHEVVEQFGFDMPVWTIKVRELFYTGLGYGGLTFVADKHPFNEDFEYPKI